MNSAHELLMQQLSRGPLLCDGAFGTYYAAKYDTSGLPELANTAAPERVTEIHQEYLCAGARLLRTNTFASNTVSLRADWPETERNLRQGYRLAVQAAAEAGTGAWVAADIGPIPYDTPAGQRSAAEEYVRICRVLLEEGASLFVFETFASMDDLHPALELIGGRAAVIVQFAVDQFGYSAAGLSAGRLIAQAMAASCVTAAGLNCGVGPAHMQQILRRIPAPLPKPLTAFPNAGYPQQTSSRASFPRENLLYFVQKLKDLAADGVAMLGGCCGSTPEHIAEAAAVLQHLPVRRPGTRVPPDQLAPGISREIEDNSFFAGKNGKKLIAVELAPPFDSDDRKLMDAAHRLRHSGADVLTFPDSPSGRTRVDSILMAEKVARETGLCVMPHICCRDKNAIAIRAQMLGAHINHIRNFLVITGDPVPTMARSTVKSVFNFDSVGMMRILQDMNQDQFPHSPLCYGGAVSPTRKRVELEIGRVKKKMAAGASFFLSQPICSAESAERLRQIKSATGARILCGIMPFVSLRNASFIRNEISGVEVTDEVLHRFRSDMTKAEGEQVGIDLAREVIAMTADFADGYYFSFPFNRVEMLDRILAP